MSRHSRFPEIIQRALDQKISLPELMQFYNDSLSTSKIKSPVLSRSAHELQAETDTLKEFWPNEEHADFGGTCEVLLEPFKELGIDSGNVGVAKTNKIEDLEKRVKDLDAEVVALDVETEKLRDKNRELTCFIPSTHVLRTKNREIKALKSEVLMLKGRLSPQDTKNVARGQQVGEMQEQMDKLKSVLDKKDALIAKLQRKE